MANKILIGAGVLGALYIGYLYKKQPKATLQITDDDSAILTFGDTTKNLDVKEQGTIKKGAWEITASANSYKLKFLGFIVESGEGSYINDLTAGQDYIKMSGKKVDVKYDF